MTISVLPFTELSWFPAGRKNGQISLALNDSDVKNSVILGPCHSLGGWLPGSHCSSLGSIPAQVMWGLWWTKWHWGRFSPTTSASLASSHCINCSIFINHPSLTLYSLHADSTVREQKIMSFCKKVTYCLLRIFCEFPKTFLEIKSFDIWSYDAKLSPPRL
jgi:hypothetical protein